MKLAGALLVEHFVKLAIVSSSCMMLCSCAKERYAANVPPPIAHAVAVPITAVPTTTTEQKPPVSAADIHPPNHMREALDLEKSSDLLLTQGSRLEQLNRPQEALSEYLAARDRFQQARELTANIPPETRPAEVDQGLIESQLRIAQVYVSTGQPPDEIAKLTDEAERLLTERTDIDNALIAKGWHLSWTQRNDTLWKGLNWIKAQQAAKLAPPQPRATQPATPASYYVSQSVPAQVRQSGPPPAQNTPSVESSPGVSQPVKALHCLTAAHTMQLSGAGTWAAEEIFEIDLGPIPALFSFAGLVMDYLFPKPVKPGC